jgi:hypothetical protein
LHSCTSKASKASAPASHKTWFKPSHSNLHACTSKASTSKASKASTSKASKASAPASHKTWFKPSHSLLHVCTFGSRGGGACANTLVA